MHYHIVLLPGDGIGPEVTAAGAQALEKAAQMHGFALHTETALIGGCAYDAAGHPLPPETLALCRTADAVLLGAVGGPQYDTLPAHLRPEAGALLPLRKELGLFANLRPARLFPALAAVSALRPEITAQGLDLLVVRELTGGIYFGQPKARSANGESATDTCTYSRTEIERILHTGFQAAQKRAKRLCSVDKANVLETSRLWRETAVKLAPQYPGVELSHMLVDNCAMQLVRDPRQFDVIVTENMFGDILSDEASMLTGSLGMLPSASLGSHSAAAAGGVFGLYEPVHGSAPDIAGKNAANPLAAILSAAMLLRHSLAQPAAADCVEKAVAQALHDGLRTADIAEAGTKALGTREMTEAVLQRMQAA